MCYVFVKNYASMNMCRHEVTNENALFKSYGVYYMCFQDTDVLHTFRDEMGLCQWNVIVGHTDFKYMVTAA